MQTISADEFKKRYGENSLAQFSPPKDTRPSIYDVLSSPIKQGVSNVSDIGKNIFNDVKQGGQNILEDVKKTSTSLDYNPQEKQNVGTTILGTIGNIAKTAFSPITETVGKGVNDVADKLSNVPAFQKFANSNLGNDISENSKFVQEKLGDWAQKHPEAAKDLQSSFEVAQLALGAKGEKPAANLAENAINKTGGSIQSGLNTVKTGLADTAENITQGAKNIVDTAKNKINPPVSIEEQALKDATPSYSKKLIGERGIKNADGTITPRVQEGGIIEGRKVNPTQFEKEAGVELTKVKDYPVNGTNLEKYQAVQPEISARSEQLMQALKDENILRPPQQIRKVIFDAVDKVPEESLLLQKSDPVIKNYMRVAQNAIDKADGTLAGELKVRQLLDQAYKNARGKSAFGSDRISALDDIHSAARDALNADIIAKAKNVDVKASLKSQWDLMRASDVLRDKAESEAGTVLGRLEQQFPKTSKLVKAAGRAAGVGVGVDLIH